MAYMAGPTFVAPPSMRQPRAFPPSGYAPSGYGGMTGYSAFSGYNGFNGPYGGHSQGFGHGDMSSITRGIWIGGRTALTSANLNKAGIRSVVNASQELMESGVVDWGDLNRNGITVRHVPLGDTVSQRIIPLSPDIQAALQFIHGCVSSGQQVLVNCAMGISRSPTIVIAYLIVYQGMSYEEALNLVASTRPGANPNPGFQRQLQQLAAQQRGGGYGATTGPQHGGYGAGGATVLGYGNDTVRPYIEEPRVNYNGYAGYNYPLQAQASHWSMRGFLNRLQRQF